MTELRPGQSSHRSRVYAGRRLLARILPAVVLTAMVITLAAPEPPAAGAVPDGSRDAIPAAASGPAGGRDSGPLVGTDALGRKLADHRVAPAPRDDRTVGVFYVLWHGSNDLREYKNVFDNNATLAKDPLAWQHPGSGAFPPPGHFAYWGEPLYGYYRSDDAWVVRRHLQLLADAQVDYLVLDTSNWELYKPQVILLMRTIVDLQAQGVRAPQLVFMTHTESTKNMDELYRTFYADDAPHRYPSTWFHWDGKPLILGGSPSQQVRSAFTFRHAQWPNEPRQPSNGWDWISFDRPQRGNYDAEGNLEQMAVSPAQNSGSSAIFSYTAWYGLDERPSLSRSFHDGAEDETPGAENRGHNFQEQWDHAIASDPETILILEWNEWIAGNWAGSPNSPLVFYDVVNTRWSRDLEPMAGGYGDNYYLQMVDNIRRYKGVNPPADTGAERTIDLDRGFGQWRDVRPEYADHEGDTMARNHPGVGSRTYVNTTGRHDVVASKVARDRANVYFQVRTADALGPISGSNWMTLYLDVDSDQATGWNGYERRVSWSAETPNARLERGGADGRWSTVDDRIPFRTAGNELMLSVPRSALGASGDPLRLQFKWWDNQQAADIMDTYVSGDAAPDGRLNYLYDTAEQPAARPVPGPPQVAALPEQRPGLYRIENDDRSTDYEAFVTPKPSDWVEVADPDSSGGSYSYLYNPGGRTDPFFRTFIRAGFDGNAVRWLTRTGPQGSEAEVFVDGLSQGVVNLYSAEPRARRVAFEVRGLPAGQHEIMVMFKPQRGTYYHDAFEYAVGSARLPDGGSVAGVAETAYASSSSFAPAKWFATNAGQVNDDDLGTFWRGTVAAGDQVALWFGRSVVFDRVELVPRTAVSTVTSYDVQVLEDGGWRTARRGGRLDRATTLELGPTRADGLRVRVFGTTGGGPELAELRVPGAAPVATSPTAWEFTNGAEGWTGDGSLGQARWVPGTFGGDLGGAAGSLLSAADLRVDAKDFRSVLLKLRNQTAVRQANLRWVATTEDGQTVTGQRPIRIEPNSGYTDYVADLTDAPGWTGTIRRLGVEFPAGDGRVDLQYLRMAPDHAAYAAHFGSTDHGWTADGAELTWQQDGTVQLPVDGEADVVSSPTDLRTDITNAGTVTVRLRNSSSATSAVLAFSTVAEPGFGADRRIDVDLVAHDEDYTSYQVDLSGLPGWRGTLQALRLEFVGARPAETVEVDVVRVEPYVLGELSTVRSWSFDRDAEGWGNPGGIEGFGWSNGGVGGTIVGADPQFYSAPSLRLDITDLKTVTIRMAIETEASFGTVYFTTESSPNFSETNSVRIPLRAGQTGYADYVLDLSGISGWNGVLRQLRVDPEEGDSSGTFHVDRIEIS